MEPLSNFDLYLNFAVAVLMPILIVANLMDLSSSPLQRLSVARESRT